MLDYFPMCTCIDSKMLFFQLRVPDSEKAWLATSHVAQWPKFLIFNKKHRDICEIVNIWERNAEDNSGASCSTRNIVGKCLNSGFYQRDTKLLWWKENIFVKTVYSTAANLSCRLSFAMMNDIHKTWTKEKLGFFFCQKFNHSDQKCS